MNQIANQLLVLCYTQAEATRALRIIKDYLNHQFFSPRSKQPQLTQQQTDLINQLGKDFLATFQADQLSQQLSQLEKAIEQAKLVTIYLPFEMPAKELGRLGQWMKANLGQQVLFEVKTDPSLIGGCALSFQGVYKDYSLRAQLKANHEAIIKSLGPLKV